MLVALLEALNSILHTSTSTHTHTQTSSLSIQALNHIHINKHTYTYISTHPQPTYSEALNHIQTQTRKTTTVRPSPTTNAIPAFTTRSRKIAQLVMAMGLVILQIPVNAITCSCDVIYSPSVNKFQRHQRPVPLIYSSLELVKV